MSISRSFCLTPLHAFVLLVLAGCEPAQPARNADLPASVDVVHYTPVAERDSLLTELALNERRWNAARPVRYRARLRRTCAFCQHALFQLVVDAGALVELSDSSGHRVTSLSHFQGFSVDSLFRLAEAAIRDSGQRVTVRYDAALGYPREIDTDSRLHVTDSWLRIRLDDLRSVVRQSGGRSGRWSADDGRDVYELPYGERVGATRSASLAHGSVA